MCFVQRSKKGIIVLGLALGCSAHPVWAGEGDSEPHSTWDVVVIAAQTRYWEARADQMSAQARFAGAQAQLAQAQNPPGQRSTSAIAAPTHESPVVDSASTSADRHTAPPWQLVSVGRRADGRASAKIRINEHIKVVSDGEEVAGYTVRISTVGRVTVNRYRQAWEL